MHRLRKVLPPILALLAAPACAPLQQPAADVFDIVCEGSVTRVRGETRPFWAHYRIDLKRRLWCMNSCEAASPIHEIAPSGLVTLEHAADRTITFDPATNQLTVAELFNGEPHLDTNASCRREAFRGLPGDPPQGGPAPKPPEGPNETY